MWADALLAAERAHAHRLLLWGLASFAVGLAVLVVARRRERSSLLFHFALQTALWGAVTAALGLHVPTQLRDVSGATRLDRLLWLNVGLDAGYTAVGATLALAAWVLGRRLGGIGAGVAIAIQGLALLLLDARFILVLERSL